MSDSTAPTSSSNGGGSAQDGARGGKQAGPGEPPSSLNVAKLRTQHGGEGESVAMSPTTSVKALLADTNAAPPPASSSSSSQSSSSTFEQQQAALRKRKNAGSTSKDDSEEQAGKAGALLLGRDSESLKEDGRTLPPAPLIDGNAKPGASSSNSGAAARPTFQQTLQDLRQFLLHFLRVLPFKGLQAYLKKIIGPVVRLFVRGVARILHRGQFGLASNLAFDIHLLLWKVSLTGRNV